jgi:hypothetical protein
MNKIKGDKESKGHIEQVTHRDISGVPNCCYSNDTATRTQKSRRNQLRSDGRVQDVFI